ncbi:MAG: hypothetical protein ACLUOD_09220 [[Clostridium] innocuum]
MEQAKKRAQCVLMEHVGSMEYYQSPQQDPKQVFSDINFEALEGEVWAILGTSAFEVRLLLEIIANARPLQGRTLCTCAKGHDAQKKNHPSTCILYRKYKYAVYQYECTGVSDVYHSA